MFYPRLPIRPSFLLVALLLVSACTQGRGRDFGTVSTAGLALGATTEQEIVARYGQPSTRNTLTRNEPPPSERLARESNPAAKRLLGAILRSEFTSDLTPGVYSTLGYSYSQIGFDREFRSATFTFYNDRLVSYELASSFPADATAFDLDKASSLLGSRNATTKQVTAALGAPAGRVMYPFTRAPGHERWIYRSLRYHNGLADTARLEIAFDATGRELDFRIQASSQPQLVVSAAGPIFVPGPVITARR